MSAPLDVAVAAARAGGLAAVDARAGLDVARKHDDRANIVTSADLASQHAVTAVIHDAFPAHTIVGEEGTVAGDGTGDRGAVWYVDPLDGTTNFVHGVPFWCVSVALHRDGDVACGAVYDPVHDHVYAAARGEGATCNGAPLRVAGTDRLDRALLVAMAQSDDPAVIREYVGLYGHLMNVARGVRHLGSPALALCLVAAGRLDAYVERYMDPWDILAGKVILEEAGGTLTCFDGSPLRVPTLADIAASNTAIHDDLLAELAASTDEGAT